MRGLDAVLSRFGSEHALIMLNFAPQHVRLENIVALTTEDIKQIAHLARIGLDESALEPLREDLSTVLSLVEQLNAIDTEGVEPMAHPGNAVLRLRDDEVSEENARDSLQAPAPAVEQGYFLVPRVIE